MLRKFVNRVIVFAFIVMLGSLFVGLFLAEKVNLLQAAKDIAISGLFGASWGAIIATVEILHDLGFGLAVKIIVAIIVGAILGVIVGVIMEMFGYATGVIYVTILMFSFMGLGTGAIISLRLRKIAKRKSSTS